MYVGTVRPVDTKTISVKGAGLEEIAELVAERIPEGWVATSSPVEKSAGVLTAAVTMSRRDGVETVTGVDFAAVRAAVKDGYQLIAVRRE